MSNLNQQINNMNLINSAFIGSSIMNSSRSSIPSQRKSKYYSSTRIRRTISKEKRKKKAQLYRSECSTPELNDELAITSSNLNASTHFYHTNNSSQTVRPTSGIGNRFRSHSNTAEKYSNVDGNLANDFDIEQHLQIDDSASSDENSNEEEDRLTSGFSFVEWLEYKKKKLERKHHVITDEQYELLISLILHNPIEYPYPNLVNDESEYDWAIRAVKRQNLKVVKRVKRGVLTNVIVQEKVIIPPDMSINPDAPDGVFHKYYREIPKYCEIEEIIRINHQNTGHRAYRETHVRIQPNYSYITRLMCRQFKRRCIHCNRQTAIRDKGVRPVNPIFSKDTFHHVQLDLIDFRLSPAGPDNRYHYVAHLIDHYSTYHVTEAIETKSAYEILHFLRKAFSVLGFPLKLHTDNGSEFTNSLVAKYLEAQNIELVHGKPYKPTTQGKVERANRSIQEIMQKLVSDSKEIKHGSMSCMKPLWHAIQQRVDRSTRHRTNTYSVANQLMMAI